MRPDPVVVRVGEYSLTFHPLPLRDVRRIEKILSTPDLSNFDRSVAIAQVGLEKAHPDLSSSIEDLYIPYRDVDLLAATVLELSGFTKSSQSGEQRGAAEGGT